jgi:phosphohistidine phosphatase
MRLYLVRHAIAAEPDRERWPDDSERPLTPRGVRRSRRAARGLSRVTPPVDFVLSSPYVRAWDTALILEDEAGWPAPLQCPELTEDNPAALLDALKPFSGAESIALVGHEPNLSRFASALLSPTWGPWLQFRKNSVALLQQVDEAEPARFELAWFLPPRVLRALGA